MEWHNLVGWAGGLFAVVATYYSTRRLEHERSRLQSERLEHEVRFRKLHDRMSEALIEIFSELK